MARRGSPDDTLIEVEVVPVGAPSTKRALGGIGDDIRRLSKEARELNTELERMNDYIRRLQRSGLPGRQISAMLRAGVVERAPIGRERTPAEEQQALDTLITRRRYAQRADLLAGQRAYDRDMERFYRDQERRGTDFERRKTQRLREEERARTRETIGAYRQRYDEDARFFDAVARRRATVRRRAGEIQPAMPAGSIARERLREFEDLLTPVGYDRLVRMRGQWDRYQGQQGRATTVEEMWRRREARMGRGRERDYARGFGAAELAAQRAGDREAGQITRGSQREMLFNQRTQAGVDASMLAMRQASEGSILPGDVGFVTRLHRAVMRGEMTPEQAAESMRLRRQIQSRQRRVTAPIPSRAQLEWQAMNLVPRIGGSLADVGLLTRLTRDTMRGSLTWEQARDVFQGRSTTRDVAQQQIAQRSVRGRLADMETQAGVFREAARAGKTYAEAMDMLRGRRIALATGNPEFEQQYLKQAAAFREARNQLAGAGGTGGLVGAVGGFIRRSAAMLGVVYTYRAFNAVLSSIGNNARFFSQIEQMRLGVAETISVAGRWVDQFGKVLPLGMQFARSMTDAELATRMMVTDAIKLGMPVEAIAEAFTVTAGLTKAAGFNLRQSMDFIESLITLSQRLNVSSNILARDVDNIITGQRVQMTVLGRILQLDEADVKLHAQRGDLMDYLLEKLRIVTELLPKNVQTWVGLSESIRSSLKAITLEGMAPLEASLKRVTMHFRDWLADLAQAPVALEKINKTVDAMVGVLSHMPIVKLIQSVPALLTALDYVRTQFYREGRFTAEGGRPGETPEERDVRVRGELATGVAEEMAGWTRLLRAAPMLPAGVTEIPSPIGAPAGATFEEQLTAGLPEVLRGGAPVPTGMERPRPGTRPPVGPEVLVKLEQFYQRMQEIKGLGPQGAENLDRMFAAYNQLTEALGIKFETPSIDVQKQVEGWAKKIVQLDQQARRNEFAELLSKGKRTRATHAQLTALSEAMRQADVVEFEEAFKREQLMTGGSKAEREKAEQTRRQYHDRQIHEINTEAKRREEQINAAMEKVGGAAHVSERNTLEQVLQYYDEIAKAADRKAKTDKDALGHAGRALEIQKEWAEFQHRPLEERIKLTRQIADIERGQIGVEERTAEYNYQQMLEKEAKVREQLAIATKPEEQQKAANELAQTQARQQEYLGDALNARQAMLDSIRREQLEVAKLEDNYIYLGETIRESISEAVTGIALGTGNLGDLGKRAGEAVAGRFIKAFIDKKLEGFDPPFRKNFLVDLPEVGAESGDATGAAWQGGMLGRMGHAVVQLGQWMATPFRGAGPTPGVEEAAQPLGIPMREAGEIAGREFSTALVPSLQTELATSGKDLGVGFGTVIQKGIAQTGIKVGRFGMLQGQAAVDKAVQQAVSAGVMSPEQAAVLSLGPGPTAVMQAQALDDAGLAIQTGMRPTTAGATGAGGGNAFGAGLFSALLLAGLGQGLAAGHGQMKDLEDVTGVTKTRLVKAFYSQLPLIGSLTNLVPNELGPVGAGMVGGSLTGLAGGAAISLGASAMGASLGGLAGTWVLPVVGTIVGAVIGAIAGQFLFQKPTIEAQVNKSLNKMWRELGWADVAKGPRGLNLREPMARGGTGVPWPSGYETLLTEGMGAGYAYGSVNTRAWKESKWVPNWVRNAILNTAASVRFETEDARRLIQEFTQALGKDFDDVGMKLAGQWVKGRISTETFRDAIADVTAAYYDLPPAIDEARLGLVAFGKEGLISLERVKRVAEDVKSAVVGGMDAAFMALVESSSPTQAARAMGDKYAQTFRTRVSERLLQQPGVGDKLTESEVLYTQAAEALAKGDFSTAKGLMEQARQAYVTGRQAYIKYTQPIAYLTRLATYGMGVPFQTGTENQTGYGMPSYQTEKIATVTGLTGQPQVAMVHGGEKIIGPNAYQDMMQAIKTMLGYLQQGQTIVVTPTMPNVSLKIGQREFAQLVVEATRTAERTGTQGGMVKATQVGVK